jgi:NADH-quinone oxidoreductase subunit J
MNIVEIAFFALCAALTFGGGLITVGSRRPIRSAMGLLTTILGICGLYLLLSAEFLAAIQLIVYAGAVVILFIFVVMLLGSASTSPPDARSAVPRYVGAGVFLLSAVGAAVLVIRAAAEATAEVGPVADGFGSIEAMGHEIFTTRVVPFELTGALLLVAVVGALAVARGLQKDPTQYLLVPLPPGEDPPPPALESDKRSPRKSP